MTVTIERERYDADLFAEALPLAQKCWNESTIIKAETCAFYGERDFAIEPDVEGYQRLADQGVLVFVSMRDDGHLKGYLIGFTYRSMHHKKILCGIVDSAYVEPEYRAYAAVLAARYEKEMRGRGVEIIGWPTHVDGPIYEMLKAQGYVGDDIVMEKRL
jgi:hypothetical protein